MDASMSSVRCLAAALEGGEGSGGDGGALTGLGGVDGDERHFGFPFGTFAGLAGPVLRGWPQPFSAGDGGWARGGIPVASGQAPCGVTRRVWPKPWDTPCPDGAHRRTGHATSRPSPPQPDPAVCDRAQPLVVTPGGTLTHRLLRTTSARGREAANAAGRRSFDNTDSWSVSRCVRGVAG